MNLPFCEQCAVSKSCVPDLALNKVETGNMRVPPESFCRARHAEAGVDMGDFYKNVLVDAVENPTCLYPAFPELQKQVSALESEWHSKNPQAQQGFTPFSQLPLSVTLMLTEKCNLACAYCYERFSGNIQPKTMPREVIWQTVQKYLTRETLALHPRIQWDLIGGEVFAEFDLLRYAVDCILKGYKRLGVCPKTIGLSLCTNGTLFDAEKRAWCEEIKAKVGTFDVGLSLDGVKACHDLCRNNSFDRVMQHFDWWRTTFPHCGIKGTISPPTLKYIFENVRFYVEELQLPRFYINPTFEGPWTDDDAGLYGEELIKCAEFFHGRQHYDVLRNSNLFAPVHIDMGHGPRRQNWCGCGTHMRAVDVDGRIFPCLRAVTSNISPIGTLTGGVNRQKLIPFYLYTLHNDDRECAACDIAPYCPSCVMQWVEDTGDPFRRSKKLCTMTRVRHTVSRWYFSRTAEGMAAEQASQAGQAGQEEVHNAHRME